MLFILCTEILLIKIRTSPQTKPFKIHYQLNPFRSKTINRYMEGFADDISLCVVNSAEGTTNITKIIKIVWEHVRLKNKQRLNPGNDLWT